MERYLQYYYNINGIHIHRKNNSYTFSMNEYNYLFLEYNGDLKYLEEIFTLCNQLSQNGVQCNQIILTKNNMLYVIIDANIYILIKYKKGYDEKIMVKDIVDFNYFYPQNNRLDCSNWKQLWETKLNYFEYQLNQFGYKHELLRKSFGYYSGYVELAISLLNNIKTKATGLAHRRIKKDYTLYNLFDPFNLVIDNKIRDIAEYFKCDIFEDNSFENMIHILSKLNLTNYDYQLFFIRMLYPTFYFDMYEDIMNNDFNDELIIPILEKTNYYEGFIKKLYQHIKKISNIPIIEWLE